MRTVSAGLILVSILLAVPAAQAQVRPHGELNLMMGLPQGEFDQRVDQLGFGLAAFGGLSVAQSPLIIGVELAGLIYGHEQRSEPFSTTIPDVVVDVETSNNMVMGHLVLRLQPQTGRLRPYGDVLFGGKYLFTQTQIENARGYDEEPIAASTNFDDTALSYGLGTGVDVHLYGGPMGEGDDRIDHVDISFSAGVRYLFGSEADYLKKGSIRRSGGRVAYDVERSRTDMLMPQFGIKFIF